MDRVARRGPLVRAPGALKKKNQKNLTMPKKLKGGTLWDFSTSILSQNSKKIEGGPFGKFFSSEKNLAVPKKIERGSRPVWYVTR